MLSRRNVRIKVMQMLYSLGRDRSLKFDDVLALYRDRIIKSYLLYLFNLLYFVRITAYSRQDAERKSSKLLPTEEDLRFSAKLWENALIQSLVKNAEFNRLVKLYKIDGKIDEDNVRMLYSEFSKGQEYRDYLLQDVSSSEDHQKILLEVYKHCVQSEAFDEIVEDQFPQWIDDKSLIVGAMKKTIKGLPAEANFYEEYQPPHETTVEFGEKLLKEVYESDDELLQLIEPTLKNWDAERVAVIDMILLKMALCELIHFPTIPAKVTLNEFVEISKIYSTEKSKDFINGILDRLMKKLNKEGKINKEGRGLLE